LATGSDVKEGEVEVVSALDLGHTRVGQRLDEGRYDLILLVPMACNVYTRAAQRIELSKTDAGAR
jgi:hypothetical protein